MKVLLDENFPSPPGFDPSKLDAHLDVTSLSEHDSELVGEKTPDWYLYLVANVGGYDALVTRDWSQSAQAEEMWVACRTDLSIVTWKKPEEDPVVEWAQLLAYMPRLRKLREQCGPSVFFLPSTSLSATHHVERASRRFHELAKERGCSRKELAREARDSTRRWLTDRGQRERFADLLGL